MKLRTIAALAAAAALATGCGGGGSVTNGLGVVPGQTVTPLGNIGKLGFAVGTAKLADGTVGLNVVTTFRQSDGDSATLVNTPTITAPAGFVVPATTSMKPNGFGGSGADAGGGVINATPQTPYATPPPSAPTPNPDTVGTTFGQIGGVFGAGLAPFNAPQSTSANYPGHTNNGTPYYKLPFYTTHDLESYIIGPPAVPFFNDGTYPSGYAGYLTGFTPFEAVPVTGTYTLSVLVPAANTASATFTTTAVLGNLTPLPALPAPTFVGDGKGGGTASVAVPADARIAETLIYVVAGGLNYTSGPLPGNGTTVSFTLPDNLGPCPYQGCQNSTDAKSSIAAGQHYTVYAASFDYPQFEAEPPGGKTQVPTLTGSAGQADVTLSPAASGTY